MRKSLRWKCAQNWFKQIKSVTELRLVIFGWGTNRNRRRGMKGKPARTCLSCCLSQHYNITQIPWKTIKNIDWHLTFFQFFEWNTYITSYQSRLRYANDLPHYVIPLSVDEQNEEKSKIINENTSIKRWAIFNLASWRHHYNVSYAHN